MIMMYIRQYLHIYRHVFVQMYFLYILYDRFISGLYIRNLKSLHCPEIYQQLLQAQLITSSIDDCQLKLVSLRHSCCS